MGFDTVGYQDLKRELLATTTGVIARLKDLGALPFILVAVRIF